MHQLQLPVDPRPCPRPKIALRGKHPTAYYDKKYVVYKTELEEILEERWDQDPIDYPVVVTIICMAKRPKTTKLDHPKPDVDNYAKGVLDAMNSIVLVDDYLVTRVECEKMWAPPGDPGRIHVLIERAE